jgi:hypothetical protein
MAKGGDRSATVEEAVGVNLHHDHGRARKGGGVVHQQVTPGAFDVTDQTDHCTAGCMVENTEASEAEGRVALEFEEQNGIRSEKLLWSEISSFFAAGSGQVVKPRSVWLIYLADGQHWRG